MNLDSAIQATADLLKQGKVPVALFCSPIVMQQIAAEAQIAYSEQMTINGLRIYADPAMEPTAFDVGFDEGEVQRRLGIIRLMKAAAEAVEH